MENSLSEPRSGVEIEITAPSAANSEDEMEEEFIPRPIEGSNSNKGEIDNSTDQTFSENSKSHSNGVGSQQEANYQEDELAKALDKDLAVDRDGDGSHDTKTNMENSSEADEKPANLEMIGDRVLIERDGKFELVDVSEIKAEYFEMLGINSPEKKTNSDKNSTKASENVEQAAKEEINSIQNDEKPPRNRPQTTVNGTRRRQPRNSPERRTTSAKYNRQRSDEFSHIKSMYGMSEEQLKIKRRREEAIAKRKKEEKERESEEMRRKREDAEQAFQAWLRGKLEEAKERRREEARNRPDPSLEERKREDAENAYQEWLFHKRQQEKVAKEYEERRRSDEASQFVIRDRHLCDEAFKSWLRKKRAETRAKERLKGKKKKSKPKLKKKEPLPLNSKNITYLEYYGYRNHVVL